jgi:hypothetical protein
MVGWGDFISFTTRYPKQSDLDAPRYSQNSGLFVFLKLPSIQ